MLLSLCYCEKVMLLKMRKGYFFDVCGAEREGECQEKVLNFEIKRRVQICQKARFSGKALVCWKKLAKMSLVKGNWRK